MRVGEARNGRYRAPEQGCEGFVREF